MLFKMMSRLHLLSQNENFRNFKTEQAILTPIHAYACHDFEQFLEIFKPNTNIPVMEISVHLKLRKMFLKQIACW